MPPLASNHAEPKNFQSSEIVRERRGYEEREKQPVRIVNSSVVYSWAEPSHDGLIEETGHTGAAIEAKEIEAQLATHLRHAHDRPATRHQASPGPSDFG